VSYLSRSRTGTVSYLTKSWGGLQTEEERVENGLAVGEVFIPLSAEPAVQEVVFGSELMGMAKQAGSDA
jgi:hypothetical protein